MGTTEQKQIEINRNSFGYKLHRLFLPSTHPSGCRLLHGGKTNISHTQCRFQGRAVYRIACNTRIFCVIFAVVLPISFPCLNVVCRRSALLNYVLCDIVCILCTLAQVVVHHTRHTSLWQGWLYNVWPPALQRAIILVFQVSIQFSIQCL